MNGVRKTLTNAVTTFTLTPQRELNTSRPAVVLGFSIFESELISLILLWALGSNDDGVGKIISDGGCIRGGFRLQLPAERLASSDNTSDGSRTEWRVTSVGWQ